MRALILAAGAALVVSACNNDQPTANTVNVDEALAAQNVSANDTTSIDAATGEDANMAADVNYTLNEVENLENADNADADETGNAD